MAAFNEIIHAPLDRVVHKRRATDVEDVVKEVRVYAVPPCMPFIDNGMSTERHAWSISDHWFVEISEELENLDSFLAYKNMVSAVIGSRSKYSLWYMRQLNTGDWVIEYDGDYRIKHYHDIHNEDVPLD